MVLTGSGCGTGVGQVVAWTLLINGNGNVNETFNPNALPHMKGLTQYTVGLTLSPARDPCNEIVTDQPHATTGLRRNEVRRRPSLWLWSCATIRACVTVASRPSPWLSSRWSCQSSRCSSWEPSTLPVPSTPTLACRTQHERRPA